ncbi:MAG: hypothetical protein KDK36_06810, partial [Leptospiraceae bacterium]|nr:hypothetical protein [Leptospiraceae bacterium]
MNWLKKHRSYLTLNSIYSLLLGFLSINIVTRILEHHLYKGKNSDLLYPLAFWNDILKGEPLSWNLTPSPYFFPDLFLYGLFRLLGINEILSYYASSIVFIILIWKIWQYILKLFPIEVYIDENFTEFIEIPDAEIRMHLSFVSISSVGLFFLFLPDEFATFFILFHHGGIFFGLISLLLVIKQKNIYQILFLPLLFFILSEPHSVYQILIPITILLFYFYKKDKSKFNLPYVFGILIFSYLLLFKQVGKFSFWNLPSIPIFSLLKSKITSGEIFGNFYKAISIFFQKWIGFENHTFLLILFCFLY